ncbi:hypothetical protein AHAS_Ahas19G0223700 [Arachis hypogaea]
MGSGLTLSVEVGILHLKFIACIMCQVNLLLRFRAPKNVTRKRGFMLKLISLHLLMMKIWTPLNTLKTGSSTLRIRRLKGLTHTRTSSL